VNEDCQCKSLQYHNDFCTVHNELFNNLYGVDILQVTFER